MLFAFPNHFVADLAIKCQRDGTVSVYKQFLFATTSPLRWIHRLFFEPHRCGLKIFKKRSRINWCSWKLIWF
jgi:hypothetical protein